MSEKSLTILLVEDEPAMQALFGFSLKKEGFRVLKAMNGLEGIEELKKEKPDAIISDIMMPDMDGFAFREEILKNEEWLEIPFLFLTAFDNEEYILKGISLGADDFIPKTDGAKVVVSKLRNALRKREEIKKRFVGEMGEASKSTGMLLQPPSPPKLDGYKIKCFHQGYEHIPGGDFVDYIRLDDRMIIVLGDAMGKRWKAWVFAHAYAAYIRSTIRSLADELGSDVRPAEVLRRLNKTLHQDDKVGESICAITLICIKDGTGEVSISNALQYPLLKFEAGTKSTKQIQTNSTVLGLTETGEFEQIDLKMESGDYLCAATDGITEASGGENSEKTGYGLFEKVTSEFLKNGKDDPAEIAAEIYNRSGIEQSADDATMIVLRKN